MPRGLEAFERLLIARWSETFRRGGWARQAWLLLPRFMQIAKGVFPRPPYVTALTSYGIEGPPQ